MTKVAIIGTQGVPARYGGFESLVENLIGTNHSPDVDYTVLCSAKDLKQDIKEYKGAHLKYVPLLRANGVQSIPYDMISMLKVVSGYDVILVLGVSGCIFLPVLKLLSKSKIIVNIDGLEHKREKWGKIARSFLKYSEAVAVHNADIVISDNKGIQDYVTETYRKKSEMIAYGGDHVLRDVDTVKEVDQSALLCPPMVDGQRTQVRIGEEINVLHHAILFSCELQTTTRHSYLVSCISSLVSRHSYLVTHLNNSSKYS